MHLYYINILIVMNLYLNIRHNPPHIIKFISEKINFITVWNFNVFPEESNFFQEMLRSLFQ